MSKTMSEIRDAEAIAHAREMFKSEGFNSEIHNDLKFACRLRAFKAGFDCRDKMDNEALKLLLDSFGCGSHSCYFVKPTGMGVNGPCRCRDNQKDALAKIRELKP